MKNVQLLSLVPERDCTLLADLRETGKGKRLVDCNGLWGIGCDADDLPEVMAMLAVKGWHRVGGERGGPEGVATVYLENPGLLTPPRRSPEMAAYLASR